MQTTWTLIEYANGLDIPDEFMECPVVQALAEAANDSITWSNVCLPHQVITFARAYNESMTGHLPL